MICKIITYLVLDVGEKVNFVELLLEINFPKEKTGNVSIKLGLLVIFVNFGSNFVVDDDDDVLKKGFDSLNGSLCKCFQKKYFFNGKINIF